MARPVSGPPARGRRRRRRPVLGRPRRSGSNGMPRPGPSPRRNRSGSRRTNRVWNIGSGACARGRRLARSRVRSPFRGGRIAHGGEDLGLAIGYAGQVLVDRGCRPSPGRDRVDDRLGTGHHVATREDPGPAGGHRPGIRHDACPAADLDAGAFGQDGWVRLLADGHQDRRGGQFAVRPRDRFPWDPSRVTRPAATGNTSTLGSRRNGGRRRCCRDERPRPGQDRFGR